MVINKSQKYISGIDLIKRWDQRWERDANAKKCSLGLDIVLFKLIDAFDLPAIEGGDEKSGKGRPIIIHNTNDSKNHIFGIEKYLFDREGAEQLENEDHSLILEYMIDSEIIDAAYIPKEPDPQEAINRLKRRLANITSTLKRKGLSSREKTYLNQKKGEVKKEIERQKEILPAKKNLREDQEDKKEVQKIAKSLWYVKRVKIRIKEMSNRPEIKIIVGKRYKPKTVHGWLSEVAPKFAKQPGRPKGRKQT